MPLLSVETTAKLGFVSVPVEAIDSSLSRLWIKEYRHQWADESLATLPKVTRSLQWSEALCRLLVVRIDPLDVVKGN